MPYLPEEAAVIDGLICDYLISPRLASDIRDGYRTVHEHLQSNLLTESDYRRILAAIDFYLVADFNRAEIFSGGTVRTDNVAVGRYVIIPLVAKNILDDASANNQLVARIVGTGCRAVPRCRSRSGRADACPAAPDRTGRD